MKQIDSRGYGVNNSVLHQLHLMHFKREAPKEDEVLIEVLYCGVCHSDLHQIKNDWSNTIYPCIPGHEIIGRITQSGSGVSKFKTGDLVGVGCMIDSCRQCHSCKNGEEQYCEGPVGWTATYNGYMNPKDKSFNTFGGYSNNLVVKESFVLRIPGQLEISAAAPILCAGVTTYSPLKHWKVKAGDKVGVIGFGGLGHMAVKIAIAMGANVTVVTTSENKTDAALQMGAEHVILSGDKEHMKKHELSFDFMLNTIPDKYDINPYICLLKRDAVMVVVGLIGAFKKGTDNDEMIMHRRSVAGSLIGSIEETQEVLDFCAKHNIAPDVELIPIQDINKAFKKMEDKEIRFRFVIDMQSLEKDNL